MAVDHPKLSGVSILVLEDEYILGDEARAVLADAGAEVIGPFVAAADALDAMERIKPDFALLDLDLGSGPDFEPARALRRRGVPLVFFTGYDVATLPRDLRNQHFVGKPVFMAAIVDAVASACGLSGNDGTEPAPRLCAQGQAGF